MTGSRSTEAGKQGLQGAVERYRQAVDYPPGCTGTDLRRHYDAAVRSAVEILQAIEQVTRTEIADDEIQKLDLPTVFKEYAREVNNVVLPDSARDRVRSSSESDTVGGWTARRKLLVIVGVAVVLGALAGIVLSCPAPWPEFGKAFLNLGVVGIGGALVGLMVSSAGDHRAKLKTRADQRNELLARTRTCHLHVVQAQRVMRTDDSPAAYRRQMLKVMRVADALEDIERDVVASDRLFDKDGDTIARGLRFVVAFLHAGYGQFHRWAISADRTARPAEAGGWLEALTNAGTSSMPIVYEIGITLSKGHMRFHVYGAGDPQVIASMGPGR